MKPTYIAFQESYLDHIVKFYLEYYNSKGGSWTYEKAYKRIHQITSMEDSMVLMQFEGAQLAGFLMGYFKEFDDSRGFYIEEILVSSQFQHKGYGSDLLRHLKAELNLQNCDWIELLTTTGEPHQRFYSKNGYTRSDRLVLEYLDLK